MTRAEKSEKGHAFEGGTSGIQQAACEALNPVKDCGKMAFEEMRTPLSLLLQNRGLASCPRHCEVCLGATVLGFHSALGTNMSSSSARDSSLIGPFSKELAREGSDFLGPSRGVLWACLSESSNKSS